MTEDNLHTKVDLENGSPAFAKPVLGAVPSVYGKMKRICKTEFKYVSVVSYDGVTTFRAEICKYKWMKCFANCREAALAVDKKLIEKGQQPVNILVKRHCT